jgi:hypothetical protein
MGMSQNNSVKIFILILFAAFITVHIVKTSAEENKTPINNNQPSQNSEPNVIYPPDKLNPQKISFRKYIDSIPRFIENINLNGFTFIGETSYCIFIDPEVSFNKRGALTVDGSYDLGKSTESIFSYVNENNEEQITVFVLYTDSYIGRDFLGVAEAFSQFNEDAEYGYDVTQKIAPIETALTRSDIISFDNLVVVVTISVDRDSELVKTRLQDTSAIIKEINRALIKTFS